MRRPGRFDAIVVETTGLADPVPVAQTFFMDDDVRSRTKLDAVVALVDAKHLPLRLKDSREAEDQIAFADVVVINKTDLVSPKSWRRSSPSCGRSIRRRRSTGPNGRGVELAAVLDRGAFDLKRALENEPHFLDGDHDHDHDHGDHGHDHDHSEAAEIHDVTVKSFPSGPAKWTSASSSPGSTR